MNQEKTPKSLPFIVLVAFAFYLLGLGCQTPAMSTVEVIRPDMKSLFCEIAIKNPEQPQFRTIINSGEYDYSSITYANATGTAISASEYVPSPSAAPDLYEI